MALKTFIRDSEIKSAATLDPEGNPKVEGGQSDRDTVLVEMKDGRTFRIVREAGWVEKDFAKAQRLAIGYITGRGLRVSDDLATAYVSTGINPGLQVLSQSPKASGHSGAICKTSQGDFIFWHDTKED